MAVLRYAARVNGLDYFESIPITFLGSWTWEYFGETERPSLNDFLMTTFGGITLGEMFHRVGSSLRDNKDRGISRIMREISALPFDPMGGLNRLVRGQWTAIGANPPEHDPESYAVSAGGGPISIGAASATSSSPASGLASSYVPAFSTRNGPSQPPSRGDSSMQE